MRLTNEEQQIDKLLDFCAYSKLKIGIPITHKKIGLVTGLILGDENFLKIVDKNIPLEIWSPPNNKGDDNEN